MLDLDSQGSASTSAFRPPQSSSSRTPSTGLSLQNVSGPSVGQHAWPSAGYCSSLLQQFVAKSQSGEPPPPAPPALLLPTKGARKCFPINDDPVPVACAKRLADPIRPSFATAASSASSGALGGHDNELEMLVPMRGLDCHQSHVSPDSGIQSVSGSPFSVHSSPVHPSGTSSSSTHNGLPGQSQSLIMSSPCPPVPTPSPPPRKSKNSRSKSSSSGRGGKKKNVSEAASKIQPAAPVVVTASRRNSNTNRRPRSCRDTVSALSSGMNQDNSIVQVLFIEVQILNGSVDFIFHLFSRPSSAD